MIDGKLLSIAPLLVTVVTMMGMGQLAIAQTIPSIPIEVNPATTGVTYNNMGFYFNTTDSHYHLKGLVQNTLHVTVDSLSIVLTFEDKSTGNPAHSAYWSTPIGSAPINPSQRVAFDIDTGYTQAQVNQFQYLKAMIT